MLFPLRSALPKIARQKSEFKIICLLSISAREPRTNKNYWQKMTKWDTWVRNTPTDSILSLQHIELQRLIQMILYRLLYHLNNNCNCKLHYQLLISRKLRMKAVKDISKIVMRRTQETRTDSKYSSNFIFEQFRCIETNYGIDLLNKCFCFNVTVWVS